MLSGKIQFTTTNVTYVRPVDQRRLGWKLVISDMRAIVQFVLCEVTVGLSLWPIVKGELDLHYDALVCLEQNSLSGCCQVSSRSTARKLFFFFF